MENKNLIKNYEPPQVEIVEVDVEDGFATSGNEDYGDKNW